MRLVFVFFGVVVIAIDILERVRAFAFASFGVHGQVPGFRGLWRSARVVVCSAVLGLVWSSRR